MNVKFAYCIPTTYSVPDRWNITYSFHVSLRFILETGKHVEAIEYLKINSIFCVCVFQTTMAQDWRVFSLACVYTYLTSGEFWVLIVHSSIALYVSTYMDRINTCISGKSKTSRFFTVKKYLFTQIPPVPLLYLYTMNTISIIFLPQMACRPMSCMLPMPRDLSLVPRTFLCLK